MTARWISAHLFHFGDLDAVVTGAVAPAVRELAAARLITGYFFLRYWEGGQHVRLRLRPTEPAGPEHDALIRERVCAAATAHFARHPSTAPHDQEAYGRFAAAAARAERLDDHDGRLRPADSVEFIPYRPEYRSYGDEACLAAVERHFVESSRLALRVMVARTPADRRTALALATLTIALAAGEPDLATAARRARTGSVAPPEEVRRVYLARREALLRQTRELWEPRSRPRGVQAEWRRSIVALRDALEPLHAAGRCAPPDPGSPHAHLAGADRTVPLILLRCAHLLHNRMGVTGHAELLTSHLLAMALSDLAEPRS